MFLIDHAWTYRSREARSMLRENGALLDRMCRLMSIELSANGDESEAQLSALSESKVEAVLDKMWSFNQTYNLYTANSLVSQYCTFFVIFYLIFCNFKNIYLINICIDRRRARAVVVHFGRVRLGNPTQRRAHCWLRTVLLSWHRYHIYDHVASEDSRAFR